MSVRDFLLIALVSPNWTFQKWRTICREGFGICTMRTHFQSSQAFYDALRSAAQELRPVLPDETVLELLMHIVDVGMSST